MYFQWLTLCLVSWHFLDSYYVFAGIFSFGTTNSPQNTCRAIYTLSDNKNTWQIDHCYVLTIAGLVSMFPFSFCPDCGFYRHFCHLEGKSPQNTYLVVCSVSDSKTPWDGSFIWSNKNRLCTFFLAVFGQLSWPLQTFLSFGRKMAPNTHI